MNGGRARAGVVGLVVIALLIVGAGLMLLSTSKRDPAVASSATPDLSSQSAGAQLDASKSVDGRSVQAAPVSPEQLATPEERLDSRHARIVGRFVRTDRAPVPGVVLLLSGKSTNERRPLRIDWPDDWTDSKAASDAAGRFSFTFVPPSALTVTLEATSPDVRPIRWEWDFIEAGETKDLGDIELLRGGTIVGRLLDSHGNPITGQEWTVEVERPWIGMRDGRDWHEPEANTDKHTGEFRIESVPSGKCKLHAQRGKTHDFDGPIVEVREGETVTADLTCPFAQFASRITVVPIWPPYGPINPHEIDGFTASANGKTLTTKKQDGKAHAFTFDGFEGTTCTLTLNDSKYAPWSMDGVEPGSLVEARLKGSAGLRLSVVDAATGDPIQHYSVVVKSGDVSWLNWPVTVLADGDHPPEGVLIDGLIPLEQVLVIRSTGRAEWSEDLYLGQGEVQIKVVRLSSGASVSGRVLVEGNPPSSDGVDVLLAPAPRRSARPEPMLLDVKGVRIVRADPVTGRFAFTLVPPGRYMLQASASAGIHSVAQEIELADSDHHDGIDIGLPAFAWVQGHVHAPAGAKFDRVKLILIPHSFPGIESGYLSSGEWAHRLEVRIAADGKYESGPLPIGDVSVALTTPEIAYPSGFSGYQWQGGDRTDLGTLQLVAGHANVHDFEIGLGFPGTLRASFTVNGSPATGCMAKLIEGDGRNGDPVFGAVIDRDGPVVLGPIRPGTYALMVHDLDDSWHWVAPGRVEIASAEERTFHGDIVLTDGALKLRREGETDPLASWEIDLRLEVGVPLYRLEMRTDENGVVRLRLPAGRYSVISRTDSHMTSEWPKAWFDWPRTSSDPAELILVDPKK